MARNLETICDLYPEHEIRYRIALCLEQICELSEALSTLSGVSMRYRNVKINMMMGKLAIQLGKCQCADVAFRAVIRESPMNLEALRGLLMLGVSRNDISNLLINGE